VKESICLYTRIAILFLLIVWDADGMRIDRRLTLLGVMLVVLSTVMATQYATTRVTFSYSIVHPSNADIRFVGSDNCSDDGNRVLRINSTITNSSNARLNLEFGEWSANMNKTYSAAFAIVNEEPFAVNITHISVTNISADDDNYLYIWLHGNGSLKATDDPTAVKIYQNGSHCGYNHDTTAWRLGYGDMDPSTMSHNSANTTGDGVMDTPWDPTSHVRYCEQLSGKLNKAFQIGDQGRTWATASDFVWVQISIVVPETGSVPDLHSGTLEFYFKSDTHYGDDS